MPSFSFSGGVSSSQSGPGGTDLALTTSELGLTFQLSTTANPGANSLIYSGASGQFTMLDSGGAGAFTFRATANTATPGALSFDGDGLMFDLGSFRSGVWDITFVDVDGISDLVFTGVNTAASVINVSGGETRDFSAIRFTLTSSTGIMSFDGLSANIVCYLEGTGIETPNGRKPIETLRPGDLVLTADGRAIPVRWIGQRPIVPRFFEPEKVNPICIRQGAFGTMGPDRNLFVSPEHAIGIEGALVNAAVLVNGTSVVQVPHMPRTGFTYFHVETEAHELLLAEGCPAESYIDAVGPKGFANADTRPTCHLIPEMDRPRITSARTMPMALRSWLATAQEQAARHAA